MLQQKLKEKRKEKNLSQTEMAEKLNITRQAYNHYETGRREPPANLLKEISLIFDCSVDYLLGKEDKKELQGVSFALFSESETLTEEEMEDVINYIKFKKSQRENK